MTNTTSPLSLSLLYNIQSTILQLTLLYKTVYIVTAKLKTNAGRKLKLTKCALWQQCNPDHTAPAGVMLAKLGINIITCSLATGMTEMISNTIIIHTCTRYTSKLDKNGMVKLLEHSKTSFSFQLKHSLLSIR